MLRMKTFKLIYDDEEPDHLETGRKSASETIWSDSDTMSADENPKTNMDASNSNSDAVSAKSAEENLTSNTDKDLHSTSSNASDVISEEEISDEDLSDDEFECELCYSVFETEDQLNLHMETHSEYTPSDDDGFDAAFGMPKENYKKTGKKYKKSGKTKKTKKKPPKREKCKTCQRYYASLETHMEKVHLAVKCTKCDKIFGDGRKLREHILRVHSNRSRFTCEVCNKSYKSKNFLRMHKESKHENNVFMCEKCGETYTSKDNLKLHIRLKHCEKEGTHHGLPNIVCDICGKTVKYQNRWRHKRSHSKTKALKCEICGRGFNETEQLSKHSRIHTGEKPYKCKTCPKAFNHNVSLKAHMKKCH